MSLDPTSRRNYTLFVVTDSKLKVTRNNTLLLVITGSISSKFQDFSSKIFEDSSKIDCAP